MIDSSLVFFEGEDMSHKNIQQVLSDNRVLLFTTPVNRENMGSLRARLLECNLESPTDWITLIIDSPGGDADEGLQFYDFLRALRAPTKGVVIGKCDSMAVPILQGCTERLALKHASFLLHNITSHISIPRTKDAQKYYEVREHTADLLQKCMVDIIARRSGLKVKKIAKLLEMGSRYEKTYLAEEALALGLIDKVFDESESAAVDLFCLESLTHTQGTAE